MDAASLRKNKWVRRAVIALLALFALWFIAWLAVPPIVKSQLQKIASEKLGRQVTVERVSFRPWSLELALDKLRVAAADPSKPPQFEVARLYADAELQSIFRFAPVVDAVRIERPQVRIVRNAEGKFDFEDILQRLAKEPEKPKSEPPHFAIYNIALTGGAVDFDDQTVGKVHALRDLDLQVPFLSNLKSQREVKVEPRLAFVLNGSRFDSGAQSTPFANNRKTEAHLKIKGFDLAPYLGYVPAGQPYKPTAGTLDADLRIDFEHGATEGLKVSGTVQAHQAKVSDARGRALLAFDSLKIGLANVRPLEGVVHLNEIVLDGPQLSLARNAQGKLNFLPAETVAASQPARPVVEATGQAIEKVIWRVQVDKVGLHGGQLGWRDETLAPAAEVAVGPIELEAGDVGWPMEKPARFNGSLSLAQASLQFKGTGTDKAATASAELKNLPLALAQPYVAQILKPQLKGQLGAQLEVAWNQPALKLKLRGIQVEGLELVEGKTSLASIRRIELADGDVDLDAHKFSLGSVSVSQPKLRVLRDKEKRWMFEQWLQSAKASATEDVRRARSAEEPKSKSDAAAKPWALSIAQAAMDGGAVSYVDEVGSARTAVEFSALNFKMQNIVPGGNTASPLEFSGRLDAGRGDPGRLGFKGKLALKPLAVEGQVDVASLPVHAFKAYFADMTPNIDLRRAYFNYRGQMQYAQQANGLHIQLVGDSALDDLRINSALPVPAQASGSARRENQLLNWKTLSLRGIRMQLTPNAPLNLDVRETSLVDSFARLLVDETGRLRLQDYAKITPVKPEESVPAAAGEAAPPADQAATTHKSTEGGTVTTSKEPVPAATAPAAATAGLAPQIHFGPISLVNGRVDFTDRFVKPNYSADLSELTGKLSAFSSQPKPGEPVLANLELRGKAQQTASLDITGKLNPLAKPLELDITAKMRDLELAPLSPYSARYTGHDIERGKLSVDLNYKIAPDGRLNATNKLVLNQLQFGDEVPGAQKTLPVRLAVALLADRNGVIDVDLPLSGSINDPQFSLGPLIWKGVLNLIVKAVTSPFNLLVGGLGGGSSESNTIAFDAGSALLNPAARESLDKVAKALTERPSLKMTIIGIANLEKERDAYLRQRLRQQAFAEKRRVAVRAGKPAEEVEPLTDAEYPELLRAVYKRADITKPRNMIGITKDLSVNEMEDLLMANMQVNDQTMRELATDRGTAVRDYLLAQKLAGDRIFLGAVQTKAPDNKWKPGAELKLDMR